MIIKLKDGERLKIVGEENKAFVVVECRKGEVGTDMNHTRNEDF